MKLSRLIAVSLLVFCMSVSAVAYAADTGPSNSVDTGPSNTVQTTSSGGSLVNPLKNIDSLPKLLSVVIDGLLEIGVIVLILAFVWVGFSFVRAQGKAAELEKARSAFIWTVIGGAILLGAKAIATLVESTVQAL